MGFFKVLNKTFTHGTMARLAGIEQFKNVVEGKTKWDDIGKSESKWWFGEDSVYGEMSGSAQAKRDRIALEGQQTQDAEWGEYLKNIQGLYNQGFSSVGMGGVNAALQLQGPKNSGLYNQGFSSVGMGGGNAALQLQGPKNSGLYNQGFSSVGMGGGNAALQLQGPKNSGLYNQHQQGLTDRSYNNLKYHQTYWIGA